MINVSELAQKLGYTEATGRWIRLADIDADPSTAYLYRRAQTANAEYVYLFRTCPDSMPMLPHRPALYLAHAKDNQEADEVHRKLWLLGNAPFIIVILPDHVRVYTGFNYRHGGETEDAGLIVQSATLDAVSNALEQFSAQEIDSGRIWEQQSENLTVKNRIDRRLLNNLEQLGNKLVEQFHLRMDVAHSLIGKYIYIRYLMDRKIVSPKWLSRQGLSTDQFLTRAATLDGFRRLVEALDDRFNGGVFPLVLSAPDAPSDQAVAYVAGVLSGDDADSGQLALDFKIYDFSYIPVELLSSIYEQFLRRQEAVDEVGAYYTPEPVAEYLVSELNYVKPLQPGMRVLDPCCGSGVFLVLVYRRLIEMTLAHKGCASLSPIELRQILVDSIFGVERNPDACYVTEFSLLLTMLSYVDPPELEKHEDFKFPELYNKRIFASDFFESDSDFWKHGFRFDWVVGNTPWVELKPAPKSGVDRDAPVRKWIEEATKAKKPVARGRVSDAFCWRVTDALSDTGRVGLFIPAKTLFNAQCKSFRQQFFTQCSIDRITNFSNLVYVLFSRRAEHPTATLVYGKGDADQSRPDIVHYGPLLVNQVPNRSNGTTNEQPWSLTIHESEIQYVSVEAAASGESIVWKLALWANRRDSRVLPRLMRLFPKTLGQICKEQDWQLQLGLQLRDASSDEAIEAVPELANLPTLSNTEMTRSRFHFCVPRHVLSDIPETLRYVRVRGGKKGLQVARAPHLFLTTNFAAYSDFNFVLPHPQIGLSAPVDDADRLRATAALLASRPLRYLLFLNSPSWGVSVSTIGLQEARAIALPELSEEQTMHLAVLYRGVSEQEMNRSQHQKAPESLFPEEDGSPRVVPEAVTEELQAYLDEQVEQVLNLPRSMKITIRDFMEVQYQFLKGKRGGSAIFKPEDSQLIQYGKTLADALDTFVDIPGQRHKILFARINAVIACQIQYVDADAPVEPSIVNVADADAERIERLWKSLNQRKSQWVYVQRNLRWFDSNSVTLFKPARLMDWTQTQALLDSDDVIGEVLSHSEK